MTAEDLANIQVEDLKDTDGAPALTKGVLRRALDRATVAGTKASGHVDIGAGLAQITLRDLLQSLWPRSAKTDALATEVQRATARGIAHLFIHTELAEFQLLCARGLGCFPDDDKPESKEAAALARALRWGTAAESQPLLAWTPLHQAFATWIVAAAVTDQISYT
ncbi:unnamed protein product, partial [Prorocentrum cordatum]